MFSFFRKKAPVIAYDPSRVKPVIRCSICTGEQVAGFQHLENGHFEEIMLLKDETDLQAFKERYGIQADIEKIY